MNIRSALGRIERELAALPVPVAMMEPCDAFGEFQARANEALRSPRANPIVIDVTSAHWNHAQDGCRYCLAHFDTVASVDTVELNTRLDQFAMRTAS